MKDIFTTIDSTIAKYCCENGDGKKGLALYKELINKSEGEEKDAAISNFIKYSFEVAFKKATNNEWIEALELYEDVMRNYEFPITVYKNVGLCMKALKNPQAAVDFLKIYEEKSPDKGEAYEYLGEIVYTEFNDFTTSIEYYEKALECGRKTFSTYSMLGHLYSTYYRDQFKDKQIDFLRKAYALEPTNRIAVKNLAYVLGKFHMTEEADKYYEELLKLNPSHSDLHSYGAYLVRHERFTEGFSYLRHRFQKEDLKGFKFPDVFFDSKHCWNPEMSIKGKDVVLYAEQGFGDTIMFSRYIPLIKEQAKSVAVIAQDGLIDLFRDSKFGVSIRRELELENIQYDIIIPMMDLPLVCNTQSDTIPFAEGYLNVPKSKVRAYKDAYIGDNKTFKIGVAYEGSASSAETQRDIPLSQYYQLMQLPNVTVYCFQVDDMNKQMDQVPEGLNYVKLGSTFKNWEDTACAMKCMDLMITTDNGVMNLAGALGVKTFGLFNSITEWRWFKTEGEDIAWYKSIKPFKCPSHNLWDVPMAHVMEEVKKLVK